MRNNEYFNSFSMFSFNDEPILCFVNFFHELCLLLASNSTTVEQVDTALPNINSLLSRDTSNDKDQMQQRSASHSIIFQL